MSDDDAVASFVIDYELSASDLSEWAGEEPSLRRRRRSSAITMTLVLAAACAGTITWLVLRHQLLACVSAQPAARFAPVHVWIWQCDPGTPSALSWNDAELVAAVVVLWSLGVSFAAKFWGASPRRQAGHIMARPGAAGRYRAEITLDGVTSVSPEGETTHQPWSMFSSVRETDQLFLLVGHSAAVAGLMLPKRGLSDPASVPRLSEFLRASATGRGHSS